MKKIIVFGMLLCGVLASAQEKKVEVLESSTPAILKKPLVIIDGKLSDLKELHLLNEDLIEQIDILKKEQAEALYGSQGSAGAIIVKKREIRLCANKVKDAKTLFFVNDKEYSREEIEKLDPNSIESLSIIKGKEAEAKYGERAKDGAIIIKLKEQKNK